MRKFWDFKNADETTGELMIYGDISDVSWWGDEVTPKQFKKDLDALGDITQLNVYINSGGGDVFAGQAIYTMLKRHKANVNVYVDGLAASIASVIAMAGDKIIMAKGSMLMVHNMWTIILGNANDLRKVADDMDKITDSVIIPAYERSGQDKDKIQALMDAETWMSDQEAVELGFADEVEETKKLAASICGTILTVNGLKADLSRFKSVPKGFLSLFEVKKPDEEPHEPDKTEADKLKAEIELLSII